MTPALIVDALLESLPHVQRWRGKTVVVKIGGAAMTDESLVAGRQRSVAARARVAAAAARCPSSRHRPT